MRKCAWLLHKSLDFHTFFEELEHLPKWRWQQNHSNISWLIFFWCRSPLKKCIHIECKCQFFFVVRIILMRSVMIFGYLIHLHTRVLLLCWIAIKQMRFQPQTFRASFLSNKKYYWMKYAIKSAVLFITLITTAYCTWSKWCCCFGRRTP